jgi:kynurenine--oxoglutarate transaminase/cysteine-S-conjugate beta-lyase/glutamine--phenylpyruvate transaminase
MMLYRYLSLWFIWFPTVQLFIITFPNDVKKSSSSRLFSIATPTNNNKPTVWNVFGEIAATTGASNLGQGFPDWDPPPFVIESLMKAVASPQHQYTRPSGYPPLVKSLASAYSTHLNREIDPFNELVITVGASQAIYLTFMTLLKPNDEVIIFEPFFDLYLRQLKLIPGVVPKFVSLGGVAATEADPWALDIEALRRYYSNDSLYYLLFEVIVVILIFLFVQIHLCKLSIILFILFFSPYILYLRLLFLL